MIGATDGNDTEAAGGKPKVVRVMPWPKAAVPAAKAIAKAIAGWRVMVSFRGIADGWLTVP